MKKHFLLLAGIIVLAGFCLTARAQEPAPPPKPDASKAAASLAKGGVIPLRLEVTVSRFQGSKKIGGLPYSLSVSVNGPPVRFRIGAQVPYATTQVSDNVKTPSYNYRDVGIGIDVLGTMMVEPGLYKMDVHVDDSSLSSSTQIQGAPTITGVPIFRNFRTGGTVILRDGQTTQLTTAADPITGEVMRVDVTLNVVK